MAAFLRQCLSQARLTYAGVFEDDALLLDRAARDPRDMPRASDNVSSDAETLVDLRAWEL